MAERLPHGARSVTMDAARRVPMASPSHRPRRLSEIWVAVRQLRVMLVLVTFRPE
jgi:hypothetical protein